MWSRAWMGKAPSFIKTFIKAKLYILANFIFFLPRRRVTITFIDITDEALEQDVELSDRYFTNVSPCGTAYLKTYAKSITMIPTIEHNATECQATKRKMIPSLPTCSVAAVAMVMD